MCDHNEVTCNVCGATGTPAQLLANRKRHVTPEMVEQRKKAALASAKARKASKIDR